MEFQLMSSLRFSYFVVSEVILGCLHVTLKKLGYWKWKVMRNPEISILILQIPLLLFIVLKYFRIISTAF